MNPQHDSFMKRFKKITNDMKKELIYIAPKLKFCQFEVFSLFLAGSKDATVNEYTVNTTHITSDGWME